MGQKITFGQELAKAEEEVDGLTSSQSQHPIASSQGESPDKQDDYYLVLAEQAPAGALLEAWIRIERAVARLGEIYGVQDAIGARSRDKFKRAPSLVTASQIVGYLVDQQVIPRTMLQAINRLRMLRNEVAHGAHQPTAGEAIAYAATAREVSEILERLAALADRDRELGPDSSAA